VLNEVNTDLKIPKKIAIGEVPQGAQVEIKLAVDVKKSSQTSHSFSYKLIHGAKDSCTQIGSLINLDFAMREKSIGKATIPSTKYERGRKESRDLESNELPSIRKENDMDQSSLHERKNSS